MTNVKDLAKKRQSNLSIASSVTNYIKNVGTMNKSTAREYALRLNDFMNFVANEYPDVLDMDNLLVMLKQGNLDPYNLLNGCAAYLSNHNVSTLTLSNV